MFCNIEMVCAVKLIKIGEAKVLEDWKENVDVKYVSAKQENEIFVIGAAQKL